MSEQQDLAELEQAFAKDPAGPAFVALSSAYLQQGRFMEAMVVCKKGIKSQPDNVEGRLLLARVYAEQGKVPKAIEEVKSLIEAKPDLAGKPAADAHWFLGTMLEKSGKFDDAIESFKEALRKQRDHAEANAALKAKGIDWSPGPSPEEIAAAEAAKKAAEEAERLAAEQAAALEAQQRAEAEAAAAAARAASQPPQQARPRMNSAPGAQPNTSPTYSGAGPVSSGPVPAFPNDPALQASYAGAYGMFSGPVPVATAGKRLGPGFTFGLGALLLLVIAAVIVILKVNKADQEQIAAHWKSATRLVESDTTGGHKGALKDLEAALKIDDDQPRVASQYALSLAIVAIERGDHELIDTAKKAVEKAKKVADDNGQAVAAQMIVLRQEGKAQEAVDLAKSKLGADESTYPISVRVQLGRSYAALGKVPDMVKVADSLKETPSAMALTFVGEAYRRVGDHTRARIALDQAMKNELNHDPARALRALVILEDDDITNLDVALDDLNTLKELGKDAVGTKQRGYASLGLALAGQKIGRPDRENEREQASARATLKGDPEVPLFDAKQQLATDPGKAIALAQEAIKADKVRLEPYLTVVEAASKTKNWSAADQALNDAQAVFGDNLELGLARANRLLAEGKGDQGVAHLKGMIAAHDVAEVYREIGKMFLRKEPQDVGQAVEWLKKAAEKAEKRSPSVQAQIYTWLGRAYAGSGDHKTAAEIYGQSLAATTAYSQAYYWIGVSLKELGDGAKARDALQKYIRAEPNGQFKERASRLLSEL